MSLTEKVWTLGHKMNGIRNIDWFQNPIPSFADCNILVVDTTTLTRKALESMTLEVAKNLFNEINKRFKSNSGFMIIGLSAESIETTCQGSYVISNYYWSPIHFQFKKIAQGKAIKPFESFIFKDYLKQIKMWNLGLAHVIEKNAMHVFSGSNPSPLFLIETPSDDVLGGSFFFTPFKENQSGIMYVLPTLDDSEKSMKVILEFIGIYGKTSPPEWTDDIKISGIEKIMKEIDVKKDEMKKIQVRLLQLSVEKDNLEKYKRLLYASDKELEQIVKESLQFIGLKNVRDGKAPEKEDGLFDFQYVHVDVCVIEVKGVKNNVELDDFRQLDNWVWDYKNDNKKSKGLLISNTYRMEDVSSSATKRMNYDDFQEYYRQHEICVLPTLTIFELINHKLKGNEINVKKIESVISSTNGVLKIDDLV